MDGLETVFLATIYGTPWPRCDLTIATSALLITPLAFGSSRKFEAVTLWPSCAFVCDTSAALTVPLAFVSPIKTRMLTGVSGNTCINTSVTLLKVTV